MLTSGFGSSLSQCSMCPLSMKRPTFNFKFSFQSAAGCLMCVNIMKMPSKECGAGRTETELKVR